MDPLTLLLQAAFYVAFAVSLVRWLSRRGSLELAVALVFAPVAGLFALSFVNGLAPALTPVVRPALIFLLLLQPWFVVHLVSQLRPVPARLSWLVLAGSVACSLLVLSFTGVAVVTLGVVAFFFAVQAASALRLGQESRRRIGVARVRLAIAAVATFLFGAAILFSGAAQAASGASTNASWVSIVTRTMALAAGIGYLIAFIPPDWLRRQAYRAMAFNVMRNLVAPDTEVTAGALWRDLAASAREILGARRVVILTTPDGPPLASVGELDPAAPPPPPRPEGRIWELVGWIVDTFSNPPSVFSRVEVPLRPETESEHLVADVDGRPLFVEDDIALLSLLGSLTAKAVDREDALITLGQARSALEESAATRASEARFRALLEADPNAVLALDTQETVLWATRQAGELFGGAPASIAGMPLADLVAVPHDLRQAGTEARPVYRADTTGKRLDGTHFPAELARTTFELDGQEFELAVVSDVSWRQEAAQIRDRFLGILSHELRTPVTSIYGGTQLLLRRGSRLDEETRNELLVNVAAESERLQRMIENLVALARIERGAETAPARPVLIDRVIRDLIERERQLWPELTIQLEVGHPVQMVAADEEYVGQIVRNLLTNAAKYSGPGSIITVMLEDAEDEVLIRVCDNGPGIDEAESDKLFSLYYRAAHQAAVAPGAGIGLFICRELVSLMGGRIWAKARPEGGSEFGFSVPAYVDEPDPSYQVRELPPEDEVSEPVPAVANGPGATSPSPDAPSPVGPASPSPAPAFGVGATASFSSFTPPRPASAYAADSGARSTSTARTRASLAEKATRSPEEGVPAPSVDRASERPSASEPVGGSRPASPSANGSTPKSTNGSAPKPSERLAHT
ncbi:MAG TPA: ATP-binding protein [Candidatus Limnocylindrales bacterium]|nr:ATP-binding protein [Candidatus Limnocylindrales bacterium]